MQRYFFYLKIKRKTVFWSTNFIAHYKATAAVVAVICIGIYSERCIHPLKYIPFSNPTLSSIINLLFVEIQRGSRLTPKRCHTSTTKTSDLYFL